jgi:hypothetical protein
LSKSCLTNRLIDLSLKYSDALSEVICCFTSFVMASVSSSLVLVEQEKNSVVYNNIIMLILYILIIKNNYDLILQLIRTDHSNGLSNSIKMKIVDD